MVYISEADLHKLLGDIYKASLNITEEMMLERLIDRYRWPKSISGYPTIERISDNGENLQDFFWTDGYIQSDKLIEFYNQGYTIIISGAHFLFKDIANITYLLYQQLGREINANCYFSKGTKKVSFDKHNHDYPVIVKNAFGSSYWEIDDKEYRLEKQDVLFIDQFVYHQVKSIDTIKLSFTFNLY